MHAGLPHGSGNWHYLVDIHVQVDGSLSVVAGHKIGHDVKNALLASALRITDVSVHIEPEAPGRTA